VQADRSKGRCGAGRVPGQRCVASLHGVLKSSVATLRDPRLACPLAAGANKKAATEQAAEAAVAQLATPASAQLGGQAEAPATAAGVILATLKTSYKEPGFHAHYQQVFGPAAH
jgi:hypothetical protein